MIEGLILQPFFAIITLVGNNFKTKIFFLLKQIYEGLSQDSIWRPEILRSGYRSQPVLPYCFVGIGFL